jgi:hypothetical protein
MRGKSAELVKADQANLQGLADGIGRQQPRVSHSQDALGYGYRCAPQEVADITGLDIETVARLLAEEEGRRRVVTAAGTSCYLLPGNPCHAGSLRVCAPWELVSSIDRILAAW